MTQRDWLNVGLKLIGVYFAVLGITASIVIGTNIVVQEMMAARESVGEYQALSTGGVTIAQALQPIAYLVCAWVLLRRTDWCLRVAHPTKDEA